MKRKWLYLATLLLVAAPAAALAYAPYLPRLLWEGYPGATWPAHGSFGEIEGGTGEALPGDRKTKNLYERAAITTRKLTVWTAL